MKINGEHICDDCEALIPSKLNSYGLTDLCDDCEPQYHDEDINKTEKTMKVVNQIERVLKHCQKVNKEYESSNHNQDCIDYNINKGWIEALNFVINTIENGSPVSDKPLYNRGDE